MIPKIKKGVRIRQEEFGALIFTNRTPILSLNQDAFAVWELIDGTRTAENIIKILGKTYSETGKVQSLAKEFITSCVELGLVDFGDPESDTPDPPLRDQ